MKRRGCLLESAAIALAVIASALILLLRLLGVREAFQDPHPPRVAAPSPAARAPSPPASPTPVPAPTPRAAPSTPPPARRAPRAPTFERWDLADRHRVRYAFPDHDDDVHEVVCTVSKDEHRKAVESFGYRPSEIQAEADAALRSWLQDQATLHRVRDYLGFEVGQGGVRFTYGEWPADEREREGLERGLARFTAALEEVQDRWQAFRDEAYRRRGLLRRDRTLLVDHGGMVVRSEPALSECAEALRRAYPGPDRRRLAGLVVAFFQQIRYEVPPDERGGRQTLGLWVPTEVVLENRGDCDSKSLAFGAVWRGLAQPVLVIHLPGHVLVGVEVRPAPRDKLVRIGNRYFVVGELAGPARRRLGQEGDVPVRGHFHYTLVEPDGHTPVLHRGRAAP